MKQKKSGVAKLLHQKNLYLYRRIQVNEGLGWDQVRQSKTCLKCGKELEHDLFDRLVCGCSK